MFLNLVSARWLLTVLALPSLAIQGENWPQFRGPRGDGTSLETNIPVRWSATENVRWKTPIAGQGHSSPVVWDDAVFLTTALTNGDRALMRLDARSGGVVWQKVVLQADREAMHRENSSASSTPAIDGTHIFTSFQSGPRVELGCYDFDGKKLWSIQPLQFTGEHGYSYSPVLYRNLVLLDCRQEGEAAVLALEKTTGAIRWRAKPGKQRISHVTPLLVRLGNQDQCIVAGSDEICSYDPLTGKSLWRAQGLSDVAVAGLSAGDGMVFATAGYPTRTRMAVRTDGLGEVTSTHVAWSIKRQVSYVPSPVFHAGHLYTVVDEGILYCFDARTGEPVWDHRLSGRFRSSLILVNHQIHATNDQGLTTVFEADPKEFRLVSTNNLDTFCYTTPAISGGRMFIRTGDQLYCLANR
ncbi:MAG: PQQ-binding-like beta-propeller repeat protein [Verrucomicrobiales bacterium]|nr:PQQ-binding-like beta-propeller repeat protein [Verrucomicrobiales bacterium]